MTREEAVGEARRIVLECQYGRFAACKSCGQDLRLPPIGATELREIVEALLGEKITRSAAIDGRTDPRKAKVSRHRRGGKIRQDRRRGTR